MTDFHLSGNTNVSNSVSAETDRILDDSNLRLAKGPRIKLHSGNRYKRCALFENKLKETL